LAVSYDWFSTDERFSPFGNSGAEELLYPPFTQPLPVVCIPRTIEVSNFGEMQKFYSGSMQAVIRVYEGPMKDLRRLYEGSIKVLSRLY
jgi:hypothetical protein